MSKSPRNTGHWFEADYKPAQHDRLFIADLGPGKYDSIDKEGTKKAISWNKGKIPFGSGDERFKTDYRSFFKPGPGFYNAENS